MKLDLTELNIKERKENLDFVNEYFYFDAMIKFYLID